MKFKRSFESYIHTVSTVWLIEHQWKLTDSGGGSGGGGDVCWERKNFRGEVQFILEPHLLAPGRIRPQQTKLWHRTTINQFIRLLGACSLLFSFLSSRAMYLRLNLNQVTSKCAIMWPGILRILTKPPVILPIISFLSHRLILFPPIPLFQLV